MGKLQSQLSGAVTALAATAAAGKKLHEDEKQIKFKEAQAQEAESKAMAEAQENVKEAALETDLVKMGADPEAARSFMTARKLGLDTKGYGMLRGKGGRFIGGYSSVAEKLAKGSLADTYSSKLINERGFQEKLLRLSQGSKSKAQEILKTVEGGKK